VGFLTVALLLASTVEACGFHHSKEYTQGHESMSKYDWLAIDQSDELLLDVL